jgi:hypothetical protein
VPERRLVRKKCKILYFLSIKNYHLVSVFY